MNERFKKIAEKAGFMLWGDEDWNPGDVVDWSMKYDRELEKFAELIVRGCIEQLNISNVPAPISAGLNLGRVAIKEHFGVEA